MQRLGSASSRRELDLGMVVEVMCCACDMWAIDIGIDVVVDLI